MKNLLKSVKKWLGIYKPKAQYYPQHWSYHIDENPSEVSFKFAWKRIFDAFPEDCVVHIDPNGGFIVTINKSGRVIYHPGFHENTEIPFLLEEEDQWATSESDNWDYDENGFRYWKLSRTTQLPMGWLHVKSYETIRNFIVVNPNNRYIRQWMSRH